MGIFFETGGMLTTVQDEGRFGYQQFGVSPAGPMDYKSFYLANILVGNKKEEGALEITFLGPQILFEEANIIAITGGDLTPRINGQDIAMYEAVLVEQGDVLSFGGMRNGCRGYIAFAGGLQIDLVMGSKSTLVRNNMGGVKGRAIQKGDRMGFTKAIGSLPHMEYRKINQAIFPTGEIVLRVVRGPQDDCFSKESFKKFFWYEATISNEFDRMGCRLECEPITHLGDGNIITDGIAFGSIQVPPNGKPIIMLADRQSTGGYTKIATVITVDLPKLAQTMPGYHIRFVEVSIKTAQDLYLREMKEIEMLEKQWN